MVLIVCIQSPVTDMFKNNIIILSIIVDTFMYIIDAFKATLTK